jgi:hypothetical protein
MRLLFGLTCASIVFSSTAFAQTDLDQLRQALKNAEDESRSVCASQNQQVGAYRHDHGNDFRRATSPQEAEQIINDMSSTYSSLRQKSERSV